MAHFLTPAEVANQLSVPKPWVLAQIKNGHLACHRFGTQTIRVSEDDLDDFIRRSHNPSSDEPAVDEHAIERPEGWAPPLSGPEQAAIEKAETAARKAARESPEHQAPFELVTDSDRAKDPNITVIHAYWRPRIIRTWAYLQGLDVAPRGQVSHEIEAMYFAAHPEELRLLISR